MERRFRSGIFFSDRWSSASDRSYSFQIDGVAFSIVHILFRSMGWRFRSFIFFSDRWSGVFDRSYSFQIYVVAFSVVHFGSIFIMYLFVLFIELYLFYIIDDNPPDCAILSFASF